MGKYIPAFAYLLRKSTSRKPVKKMFVILFAHLPGVVCPRQQDQCPWPGCFVLYNLIVTKPTRRLSGQLPVTSVGEWCASLVNSHLLSRCRVSPAAVWRCPGPGCSAWPPCWRNRRCWAPCLGPRPPRLGSPRGRSSPSALWTGIDKINHYISDLFNHHYYLAW